MSLKMKVTAPLVGLILTSFMATACSGATDATGPSAPNSPVETFSIYQGNQCAGSYYVDNAGAEACLIKSNVTTFLCHLSGGGLRLRQGWVQCTQ